MAFTNLPIPGITLSVDTTDTTYPTLDPIDGPPAPDTVGPGAANQQPKQLDYRTETLRDRINLSIETLNEMTTELLQRGGSSVGSYMKGDLDMTDPVTAVASKIVNMAPGTTATDAATYGQLLVHEAAVAAMQVLIANAVLRDGTLSMLGHLDLGTFKAINCADPTADDDIATKGYVDSQSALVSGTFLKRDGTNFMLAPLNMSGERIINCANPTANQDAVTVAYLEQQLQGIGATPTGTLAFWTGLGTTPSGWLYADGRSHSTTQQAALFAVIGYTFGGSGASFNVPDMRGRVVCGMGDFGQGDSGIFSGSGPNANLVDTVGGTSGTETHQLAVAELPSHFHAYNDTYLDVGGGNSGPAVGSGSGYGPGQTALASDPVGGGQPHNNVQPTMAMQVLIKN
jgi:microcystin-dependent protein